MLREKGEEREGGEREEREGGEREGGKRGGEWGGERGRGSELLSGHPLCVHVFLF